MQANSVALITSVVPAERLGRAVGVQAAAQAIGLAAGPLVGGALLAAGSWRLLFLVNVPAGVIGIVTGALLLPRSRDLAPLRRFDVPGLSRFIPAVGLTLLALSLVAGRGDLRWVAAPATAGSVVLAVSFARQQRRAPHPLLDRALMQRGQFRRGLSAALAGYAALFGMLVMVPVLLTGAGLESAGRVGLELAALPVAIGVVAPLAGRWADRRPLAVARIGMAVAVLALASVAAYRPTGPALAVALGGLGVGLGCFTPANNRALMLSAVGGPIGAASGLLNMSRGIGTAVGTAVVTVSVTAVAGAGPHFSQSAARAGLAVGGTVLAGICLGGLALLRRR
jgi:MFS family permease